MRDTNHTQSFLINYNKEGSLAVVAGLGKGPDLKGDQSVVGFSWLVWLRFIMINMLPMKCAQSIGGLFGGFAKHKVASFIISVHFIHKMVSLCDW